jgi:N-acetylmuramic acid 6-phosphate etherase
MSANPAKPVLATEQAHPAHSQLDQYTTEDLVSALVEDQRDAVEAVLAASAEIARAVNAASARLREGGRLIYVGAGTSGRLGLLDSVELYPTFSWPKERALALLAGGKEAIYQAVEGAEDDRDQGALDLRGLDVQTIDVVIALAASGSTPYALGALAEAKQAGALSIGIANNANAPVALQADIGIVLNTGPEVISGSTRLKAGTSQKITLNAISSGIMVRLHKVHGNLMVDLKATNAKLVRRSVRLTVMATGASDELTAEMLSQCDGSVKVAIVAILKQLSAPAARALLDACDGNIRLALESKTP